MPTSRKTQTRDKWRQRYLAQRNETLAKIEHENSTTVTGSRQASISQTDVNAVARARYAANPELKKVSSKMRYATNSESIKAAKRIKYAANPEPIKAAQKMKYAANPEPVKAAKRIKYAASPEPIKAAKKIKYAANPEPVKATMKCRYALTEPNSSAKQQHVAIYSQKQTDWQC